MFSKLVKKQEERPTLKSVANAIRTGIFIEKIYSKMSTSQQMIIPQQVEDYLKVPTQKVLWSYPE